MRDFPHPSVWSTKDGEEKGSEENNDNNNKKRKKTGKGKGKDTNIKRQRR
jgi:hypothetical protein